MSGHSTEVAFRKMWQWGSYRTLQLSPVSIISPMSYSHYFITIRFRKRGRRRLRKLQNSAPSVIKKCETDIITVFRFSVSLHLILGQVFFPSK